MANAKISELIQRTPIGDEYLEVIIPPFTAGTNRKVLLSDLYTYVSGTIDPYTFPFPQFTTATSTTAYTGTTAPAITAYATGQKFQVKVHATSTGLSTLALNGLAAKKVFTNPTTQATTGNLLINQVYILVYDAALDAASGGFLMIGSGGSISDVAFAGSWDGVTADAPSKNVVYDEFILKQYLAYTAVAITDAASMDITGPRHTLATSSATRTFTQSWTGDYTSIVVTLSATNSIFTFPAGALCVSEGLASGDNTLSLNGISGDKYYISISKFGTDYYVISKNFGQ